MSKTHIHTIKFQILLNIKKIQNVYRNFLLYVFRILFNNDPQQISFNSAKKWPRKWYRNMAFSFKKMHNGENAFEVLLFLYTQCKHHTKNAFSEYKWIHFGNMSYMYGSLIISLHGNVNNSKFIKTNSPESRPATLKTFMPVIKYMY